MNYVYSTISADMTYCVYAPKVEGNTRAGSKNIILKRIKIKGGAGVANTALITKKGFVTQISDEDLEDLEKIELFQFHVKSGHLQIERKKVNVNKVVENMAKDKSSPKTPEDYPENKAPLVGKELSKNKR